LKAPRNQPGIQKAAKVGVAVLPFFNMSNDQDQEYFSDGLTEDIITQLSKIKALKVVSRTSVMQYKKNPKAIREIGRELGVSVILEGSVQRSAEKVRITAQLIDATSDEHMWSDSYDRDARIFLPFSAK
jgi:TolB-like protein